MQSKLSWLARQVRAHPSRIPFASGQVIPILGRQLTLRHIGGRGVVRIEGEDILVHGEKEFMERRVREWIIAQARTHILALAQEKAAQLGAKFKKISLRDTSSCWGSCNQSGDLSFSWRLVFAPPEILDYVVAHEIAHLIELNHSKKFWDIVAALCPHWQASRTWLKHQSNALYAYG